MTNTTLSNTPMAVHPKKHILSLPAWLVLICIIAFSALLTAGAAIWKYAPPIPEIVRSPQQEIILTQAEIQSGQEIYLSRGGQHIGSIWGHGS